MITLQRPDPKVSALLGENKGVKDGDLIKPSQFAVPFSIDGKQMVFNTFTRQCIETEHYELFPSLNEKPTNIHFDSTDREMSTLVQADFLVKEDRDEARRYEEILAILRKTQKKHGGAVSLRLSAVGGSRGRSGKTLAAGRCTLRRSGSYCADRNEHRGSKQKTEQ